MFTGCICGYCIIPGYEAQGTECALLNLHTDEQKICYRKKASRQPGQGKPQPTCKPKGKEKSRLAQGRDSGGGGSHEVFLCSQGYTQQGRALAVISFPRQNLFSAVFSRPAILRRGNLPACISCLQFPSAIKSPAGPPAVRSAQPPSGAAIVALFFFLCVSSPLRFL